MEAHGIPNERGNTTGYGAPYLPHSLIQYTHPQAEITAPGGYVIDEATAMQTTVEAVATTDETPQRQDIPAEAETAPRPSIATALECAEYEVTADAVNTRYVEWTTVEGVLPHERYVTLQARKNGTDYTVRVDHENTTWVESQPVSAGQHIAATRDTFYPDYTGAHPSVRFDSNSYNALTADQEREIYGATGRDTGNPIITGASWQELRSLLESAEPPRTSFTEMWSTVDDLATTNTPPSATESKEASIEFKRYVERRIQNHGNQVDGTERDALLEVNRYTKTIHETPAHNPDFANATLEYTVNRHEAGIEGPSLRLIRHQKLNADGGLAQAEGEVAGVRIDGLHIVSVDETQLACGIFGATAYPGSFIEDEPILHVQGGTDLARKARNIMLDPRF
jgi:hypothetical protein